MLRYLLHSKPKQYYDDNGHVVTDEESHVSHLYVLQLSLFLLL